MIIEFSLENYKSINRELKISFNAEALKQRQEDNLISPDGLNSPLLKGIAIYGPNASGKSNLIKGLNFLRDFTLNSASEYIPNQLIDVESYRLILQRQSEPSNFEIKFITDGNIYRFGFKVDKERVHEEWLYLILKTTEKKYFHRVKDDIDIATSFSEGFERKKYVRKDSLFVSTIAQLNGPISQGILKWFQELSILTDLNYGTFVNYTANMLTKPEFKSLISKIFKAAGIAEFSDIEIKKEDFDEGKISFLSEDIKQIVRRHSPGQLKILTRHEVFDLKGNPVDKVSFDLKEESLGTQKFFAMAGIIANSLYNGSPIVIDELDARLHPKLVAFIIELFNNKSSNPNGGQLLSVNHMTNLLSSNILRRDQVVLISKDRTGSKSTTIHKQGARSDASFEKDYLGGEYGALPQTEMNQLSLF